MEVLPEIKNNILVGEPKTFDSSTPLGEFIMKKLALLPKFKVVAVDSVTGEQLTVTSLEQRVMCVRSWLAEKGILPGMAVGVCAENRLDTIPVLIATLAVGATFTPYNPLYTAGELIHVMKTSAPKIIFCSGSAVPKLKVSLAKLSLKCQLIAFDASLMDKRVTPFANIVENSITKTCPLAFPDMSAKTTVAVILCSSGTTGLPKGVELTHANLMCLIETFTDPRVVGAMTSQDVLLGLPPFFHGYGIFLILFTLTIGCKMVVVPRYSEKHFLQSVQDHKITLLFVVPTVLLLLAKHPDVPKYNLSSVRLIRCAAAPLSKEIHTAVTKRLKIRDIGQIYGMTEVSIACVFVPQNCPLIGTVGVICPGMECKVTDTMSGKSLPSYKEGEICFKGPFLMKGYKNNDQATRETIDEEGWLHTGDIGYYDAKGYMYVVDRIKELIKYKGYQVAPAELEAVLLTHPEVREAAVIGISDEKAGEVPFGFIVKQANSKVTVQDLQKHVADKVSPQKRLTGGIRFVDEIPKNTNGKILRRKLRLEMTPTYSKL